MYIYKDIYFRNEYCVLLFFFFLSFCFSSFKDEGVFLYRPDWPETQYVEEAGLDFTDLPASASPRYVPPCSVFVEFFFLVF